MGGRVIVFGDERITFDGDWRGYADVEPLWSHTLKRVTPKGALRDSAAAERR